MAQSATHAAIEAVDSLLPEGSASVGSHLDVRHIAATPPGLEVRARAELVEVDGRRLRFRVEAFDPGILVEGQEGRPVLGGHEHRPVGGFRRRG